MHGRICPGLLGGHEWNGAAYSPRLQVLVVPATDWCSRIKVATARPDPAPQHKLGHYFGGEFEFEPWTDARGWLTVFDAATGKTRWRYESRHPMIGGVVVTGGDLIFAGELTGDLLVFDATSGRCYASTMSVTDRRWRLSYAVNKRARPSSPDSSVEHARTPKILARQPTITVFALSKCIRARHLLPPRSISLSLYSIAFTDPRRSQLMICRAPAHEARAKDFDINGPSTSSCMYWRVTRRNGRRTFVGLTRSTSRHRIGACISIPIVRGCRTATVWRMRTDRGQISRWICARHSR
jgi:hypothetical protein